MADISYAYDGNTAFGLKTFQALSKLHDARDLLLAIKQKADNVTVGGTVPANLETHPLFKVATGQGANFYNDIVALVTAINPSGAAIPASIDLYQG